MTTPDECVTNAHREQRRRTVSAKSRVRSGRFLWLVDECDRAGGVARDRRDRNPVGKPSPRGTNLTIRSGRSSGLPSFGCRRLPEREAQWHLANPSGLQQRGLRRTGRGNSSPDVTGLPVSPRHAVAWRGTRIENSARIGDERRVPQAAVTSFDKDAARGPAPRPLSAPPPAPASGPGETFVSVRPLAPRRPAR